MDHFKVLIIGGAITGLTLAHCLEQAGIDYVLFEKHHDISANIGGAIGLQPNGCRILDQLGVWDRLKQFRNDIGDTVTHLPDGFISIYPSSWYQAMLGYPVTMINRTNLLGVLHTSLKYQDRIKVGAKAIAIRPSSTSNGRLSVLTEDGQHYHGDVVVGADGVHGITRAAMWQMADLEKRGVITDQERNSMTIDYACIIGITEPAAAVTQIMKPERLYGCDHPHAFWLVSPNTDHTIIWVVVTKLDKTYIHPVVPQWSKEETMARLDLLADYQLFRTIKFRDLWERTPSISSVPISPTYTETTTSLTESAQVMQSKLANLCAASYRTTRVHALETFTAWLLARYVMRIISKPVCFLNIKTMAAAVTLEYLPLPDRVIRASARRARAWRKWKTILRISCIVLVGIIGGGCLSFLW
ncbi:hypothetical protein BDW59DRAFT_176915 [Aspergillus cavernicola]|uniref:FAD-binding domain-containing protein n=1 Tax=Aspergillus cavernicola TaxID=176166 RepID=A0ABR4HBI4_9EURO